MPILPTDTKQPIIFYDAVICNQAIMETHRDLLQRIVYGQTTRGDNVKKLSGMSTLYSARLNRHQRLLYTTYPKNQQNHLHVLKIYADHDEYEDTAFKDDTYLQRYVALDQPETSDSRLFVPIEDNLHQFDSAQPEEGAAAAEPKPCAIKPLHYFNTQYIELDDTQHNVLSLPLPLLINGVAGCGKSSVIMAMLSQAAFQSTHPPAEDAPKPSYLYLADSKRLVKKMQETWDAILTQASSPPAVDVQFKTYNALLMELQAIGPEQIVGRQTFDKWYLGYEKQCQQQAKIRSKTHLHETDDEEIPTLIATYHEFRICSGYTELEYAQLGQHESSLPKGPLRTWIYTAFTAFQAYLHKTEQVFPAFFPIGPIEVFDRIYCDEAVDFSHRELKNICQLVKNRALVFCFDPHQQLFNQVSSGPFLKQQLNQTGKAALSIANLKCTYRTPENIAYGLNLLLTEQYIFSGGLADKSQEAFIETNQAASANKGCIVMLHPDVEIPEDLRATSQTASFAVATLPEFIDDARKKYPENTLILTPEEIKGLEFDTVVTYRLFDDQVFKKRPAQAGEKEAVTHHHRAKSALCNTEHDPYFNLLYTCYTRAQSNLYICEKPTKHNKKLCEALNAIADASSVSKKLLESSSINHWEELWKNLVDNELDAQANAIYIHHINPTITPEDYQKVVTEYRVPQKAIMKAIPTPIPAPVKMEPTPAVTITSAPRQKSEKKLAKPPASKPLPANVPVATKPISPTHSTTKNPNKSVLTQEGLIRNFTYENCNRAMKEGKIDLAHFYLQHILLDTKRFALFNAWLNTNLIEGTAFFDDLMFIKLLAIIEKSPLGSKPLTDLIKTLLLQNTSLLSLTVFQQWLIKSFKNTTIALDLFYWLIAFDDTMGLWSGLLQRHPEVIVELIPLLQWSGAIPTEKKTVNTLLECLRTPYHTRLFEQMIKNHPEVIHTIPESCWSHVFNKQARILLNTTLDPIGVKILAQIIDKRPSLICTIKPSSWVQENRPSAPIRSLNRYGSELIPLLLKVHPALQAQYTPAYSLELYKNKQEITCAEFLSPTESIRLHKAKQALVELNPQSIKTDLTDPLIDATLSAARRSTLLKLRSMNLGINIEAYNLLASVIIHNFRVSDDNDLCLALIMTLAPKIPQLILHNTLHVVRLKSRTRPNLDHSIVLFGDLVSPIADPHEELHSKKPISKQQPQILRDFFVLQQQQQQQTLRDFFAKENPNAVIIDPLLRYVDFAENILETASCYEENHMYVNTITTYGEFTIKQALIHLGDLSEINTTFIKQIQIVVTLDILNEAINDFVHPLIANQDRVKWQFHETKNYFYIRDTDERLEALFETLSPYFNTESKNDLVLHKLNDEKKLNFLIINKAPGCLDITKLFAAMQYKPTLPTMNDRETTPPTPRFFSPTIPSIAVQSPEPAATPDQDDISPLSFSSN